MRLKKLIDNLQVELVTEKSERNKESLELAEKLEESERTALKKEAMIQKL